MTLATLVFSVVLGLLFAWFTRLGVSTATMGLIAGGSAGIVATSDSVGADARLVTYMQYLRLVLVVVSIPLLVKVMGGHAHTVGAIDPEVGGAGTGVPPGTSCWRGASWRSVPGWACASRFLAAP